MNQEAIIEIKGLKKSFNGKEVLKNINLTVRKGENVVVLGKSGQGKSVTIKCIAGLLDQDEGDCLVFGREVKEMDDQELKGLRSKLGFLFQGAALYDSMTVRENLAFPLKKVLKIKDRKEIRERSLEVLEAVGLADAIDKMPSDLSGGMRKRLGLARTLIVRPEIMLYDEPTTGLDTITSKEISYLMLEMQKRYKTTSLIITHDIPCAELTADRILVLDEGEIIAEGTYDELYHSDDEFIRSFFK
ncbi:ABC transporter ATP-binding protein [Flavihumibacter sp.]|uniref:ABC transporter ATP-binding protein n=1 Tax=Flavihumibacter sp. TaxID=1913981 RepID=UPI002FCA3BD0